MTGLDNLDGITLDEFGNFYISSWSARAFCPVHALVFVVSFTGETPN
jgi:hypothetical protein